MHLARFIKFSKIAMMAMILFGCGQDEPVRFETGGPSETRPQRPSIVVKKPDADLTLKKGYPLECSVVITPGDDGRIPVGVKMGFLTGDELIYPSTLQPRLKIKDDHEFGGKPRSPLRPGRYQIVVDAVYFKVNKNNDGDGSSIQSVEEVSFRQAGSFIEVTN